MADSFEKMECYLRLLRKWQKAVNLVSNNTLAEAQKRHFDDSLQLSDYVPRDSVLFDLGSGAGFPGMVLGMIRPDLDVTLIESDHKKCTFLSTVSRETKTPVTILSERIESARTDVIPAIVTARALASLDKLLGYCLPWAEKNPELVMLFLKGGKAAEEIEIARRLYDFEVEVFPSKTALDGCILRVLSLYVKAVS